MDESCLYSDLHRTLWLNPAIPNHSCDRVHRSTVFFKESEHSVKDERSNFLLVSLLPSILHGSCACKAAMLSRAQGSYKQPKLWALGLINYWAQPPRQFGIGLFSFLYLKKIKFQKYMPNREIFKNGCLSPIQLATGPKYKKNYIQVLASSAH